MSLELLAKIISKKNSWKTCWRHESDCRDMILFLEKSINTMKFFHPKAYDVFMKLIDEEIEKRMEEYLAMKDMDQADDEAA